MTSRRAPAARAEALPRRPIKPAGGLPFRLAQAAAQAALDNPVVAGGAAIACLAALLIVANALQNQKGRHPAPLFETRPAMASLDRPPAAAPPVATPAAVSAPASASVPAATTVAGVPKPKPGEPSPLVRDLQQALKDRGLYAGAIDGLAGPGTADAIRAFEKQSGQPITGEASDRLLALVREKPRAVQATAVHTQAVAARSTSAGSLTGTPEERLQRVQRSLTQAGYGPLPSDGRLDALTSNTIRRYELEHGWTVTGQLSDRLLLDLMLKGDVASR